MKKYKNYENLSIILKNNDIIVAVDVPPKVITPLKLIFQCNILSLNPALMQQEKINEIIERLQKIAQNKNVRLIRMTPDNQPSLNKNKIGELDYQYSYLSNGKHVPDNVIQIINRQYTKTLLPTHLHSQKLKHLFSDISKEALFVH